MAHAAILHNQVLSPARAPSRHARFFEQHGPHWLHRQGGDRGHGPAQICGIAALSLPSFREALAALPFIVPENVITQALHRAQECLDSTGNPNNLTLEEAAAIVIYTDEFDPRPVYAALNEALWSPDRVTEARPFFLYIRLLLEALYKLPTRQLDLFRGMRRRMTAHEYPQGGRLTWYGFSSSTHSLSVLSSPQFLGTAGDRTLCHIKGRAVDISPFSMYESEDERLIEAGATFVINHVLEHGNGLSQLVLVEDPTATPLFDFLPPADRRHIDVLEAEEARQEAEKRTRAEEKRKRRWVCAFFISTYIFLFVVGICVGMRLLAEPKESLWEEFDKPIPNGTWGSSCWSSDDHGLCVLGGYNSHNKVRCWKEQQGAWVTPRLLDGTLPALGQAVDYKGSVYYLGGKRLNASTDQVLKLSNGWVSTGTPRMISPRRQFAAVVCFDKLFVLGGVGGDVSAQSGTNTVDRFDGSSWERLDEPHRMLQSRRDFQAVCIKKRLYAIGGAISDPKHSGESFEESYEERKGIWRQEQHLHIQRRGHSVLVWHHHIFVFGGSTFATWSPTTWIEVGKFGHSGRLKWVMLDSSISVWLGATIAMAGCMYKEKAWMIGGFDTTGYAPSHSALEASNKTWRVDPARLLEEANKNWARGLKETHKNWDWSV